jgi:hypothetical protein
MLILYYATNTCALASHIALEAACGDHPIESKRRAPPRVFCI